MSWIRQWKQFKREMRDADKQMTELYPQLEKLNPSNILADRIKSELNRLMCAYNFRNNVILNYKISLSYALLFILAGIFIVSLFVKPAIELTFSITLATSISIGVILVLIIKHFLYSKDRAAKRERDNAEAEYFKLQINRLKENQTSTPAKEDAKS